MMLQAENDALINKHAEEIADLIKKIKILESENGALKAHVAAQVATIPGATLRGITLRGLRGLRIQLEQLVKTGYFKNEDGSTETDFNKITTNDIVEK